MENQTTTPKQIMLNYGLVLGFIGILISVILFATGNHYNMTLVIFAGIFSIILFIVFMVLGIKKIKNLNNGLLRLSEAIKTGLGIALISGLLSIAYNFAFNTFLEPEYEKNMITVSEEWTVNTFNLPEEAAYKLHDDNLEKIDNFEVNPLGNALKGISASLIIGLIVAAIAGLIMRKSDEEITSI